MARTPEQCLAERLAQTALENAFLRSALEQAQEQIAALTPKPEPPPVAPDADAVH